jgi:hypothetical protein
MCSFAFEDVLTGMPSAIFTLSEILTKSLVSSLLATFTYPGCSAAIKAKSATMLRASASVMQLNDSVASKVSGKAARSKKRQMDDMIMFAGLSAILRKKHDKSGKQ